VSNVLALTMGDRYGIGPELIARYLADDPADLGVRLALVGDLAVFEHACGIAGVDRRHPVATTLAEVAGSDAPLSFVPLPFDAETEPLGRVTAAAGREVLLTLDVLIRAARAGKIGGIVYAPLNKQAMRLAGHDAGDELDYFSRGLDVGTAASEINILGDVWTSRVTSHVPLRAVVDLITIESVTRGIDVMAAALRRAGKPSPRIAVAALNPHAGEGGAFGMEEIEVIAPAIAAAQARQLRVEGPFPSDSVFPRALNDGFDGVVTMFHDQGQIALKLIGLGQGVTLLAGFPIPIATPGHGTAYDIAGTGRAKVDGLAAAVALAARMMREQE
jgi:4-hydroxythreonine-4-phosphate dehydrogenase